jgi:hypothetical protein
VLALPGRRQEVDDDLPEADGAATADLPGQPLGEGRRARRLQAAAEAEAAEAAAAAGAPAAPSAPSGSEPPDAPAEPLEAGIPSPREEAQQAQEGDYEQAPAYPAPSGGYDPYAAAEGADGYTYQDTGYQEGGYQEGGYSDPAYAPAAPGWETAQAAQQPYPAEPAGYDQQAYSDVYGYPAQPGYDPYAPPQPAPDGQAPYDQGYGEQPDHGEQQGRPGYPDPAPYYADGDQRRDGSEYQ